MKRPPTTPEPFPTRTRPSEPVGGFLTFHPDFRPAIYTRSKTSTIRLSFDRQLRPGECIALLTPDGHRFGTATVTDVTDTTVAAIVSNPPTGHRSYASIADARTHFHEFYPDATISGETPVTVIHFSLHDPTHPVVSSSILDPN